MTMKYPFKINRRTGDLMFLGSPPPALEMPCAQRVRFSEITPTHGGLLFVFKLLRCVFGDEGRVSEWTRAWKCEWEAFIKLGPERGRRRVSRNRGALIEWEHQVWANSPPWPEGS